MDSRLSFVGVTFVNSLTDGNDGSCAWRHPGTSSIASFSSGQKFVGHHASLRPFPVYRIVWYASGSPLGWPQVFTIASLLSKQISCLPLTDMLPFLPPSSLPLHAFFWISFLCTVVTCLLLVILLIFFLYIWLLSHHSEIVRQWPTAAPFSSILLSHYFRLSGPLCLMWLTMTSLCLLMLNQIYGGINLHGTACSEMSYVMMKYLWLFECQSFFWGTNTHITTLMYCKILEHLGSGLWFLSLGFRLPPAERVGCIHKTVKLRAL